MKLEILYPSVWVYNNLKKLIKEKQNKSFQMCE